MGSGDLLWSLMAGLSSPHLNPNQVYGRGIPDISEGYGEHLGTLWGLWFVDCCIFLKRKRQYEETETEKVGLSWVGLVELGWVELGWVELGWVEEVLPGPMSWRKGTDFDQGVNEGQLTPLAPPCSAPVAVWERKCSGEGRGCEVLRAGQEGLCRG